MIQFADNLLFSVPQTYNVNRNHPQEVMKLTLDRVTHGSLFLFSCFDSDSQHHWNCSAITWMFDSTALGGERAFEESIGYVLCFCSSSKHCCARTDPSSLAYDIERYSQPLGPPWLDCASRVAICCSRPLGPPWPDCASGFMHTLFYDALVRIFISSVSS